MPEIRHLCSTSTLLQDKISYSRIMLCCRLGKSIPIHLSNSTDGELLTFCSGLTPIGNSVVAVLEKFNINSKDVQVKILEKWLDDSSTQIANFLDSHGISTKKAPSIWDEQFVYCVLGQHGSARGYDGIQYGERIFLRKACHALGLEYEDLGIISNGKYSTGDKRLAALHVPKGWKFDPDRHVAPVNLRSVQRLDWEECSCLRPGCDLPPVLSGPLSRRQKLLWLWFRYRLSVIGGGLSVIGGGNTGENTDIERGTEEEALAVRQRCQLGFFCSRLRVENGSQGLICCHKVFNWSRPSSEPIVNLWAQLSGLS